MAEPLASGRDADVYPAGAGRVRRRNRSGRPVTEEAAIMRFLARRGFPVPAVYAAAGADLVMARVDGPTLLEALTALIMAEAASGSHVPAAVAPVAGELLTWFLAAVGGDPYQYLDRARARRAADPNLTARRSAGSPPPPRSSPATPGHTGSHVGLRF